MRLRLYLLLHPTLFDTFEFEGAEFNLHFNLFFFAVIVFEVETV